MASVDRSIRMYHSEEEHTLYEMVYGDGSPRRRDYYLAVEYLVEDYIRGLSEDDIQRIRDDGRDNPIETIRAAMENVDEVETELDRLRGDLYDLAYQLHADGYDDPVEVERQFTASESR